MSLLDWNCNKHPNSYKNVKKATGTFMTPFCYKAKYICSAVAFGLTGPSKSWHSVKQ